MTSEILKLKPGVVLEISRPDATDDHHIWKFRTLDDDKHVNITLRIRRCGEKHPDSDLQMMIEIERECAKHWRRETAYLDLPTKVVSAFLACLHLRPSE